MELAVSPDDLHAAAAALGRCARQLEEARGSFVATARHAVPDLGQQAVAAGAESVRRAREAVDTIAHDIDQLARALNALAHVYVEVDRGAVRP